MRKFFAVVLVLVLSATALVSLAACNFEEDGITITFYHTMNQELRKVLQKYIAEFNKIYPDIHVEESQQGDYAGVLKKISLAINVGDEPDMAYCYADHVASYNIAKVVLPLDSYINSTATIEAGKFGNETEMPVGMTAAQIKDLQDGGFYNEGTMFEPQEDGSTPMYTLPFSKSTELLYYNKTFFEAHKTDIDVPTHWWCTDSCPENCHASVEYVCEKIKELTKDPQTGKSSVTPLGYDAEDNWFITLAEQMSATMEGNPELYTSADENDHYKFNNPEMISIMKRLNTWFSKDYFTTKELNGGYTSSKFITQASYMSIGSSGGAKNQRPTAVEGTYPFEVGIAPIPQIDPEHPKAISQGPSICLFKNENEDYNLATWLFLKYLLTNVQFQCQFAQLQGYVPVLASADENEVFADFLDNADGYEGITALAIKTARSMKGYTFTSPAFNGSSDARSAVSELLIKCMGYSSAEVTKNAIENAFKDSIAKLK